MKYVMFTLLLLFVYTLLFGQADWGRDIKKFFREENYEEVIRLCVKDSKSYPEGHIPAKYILVRERIRVDAEKCRKLIDRAQKENDSNKAKEIIKIREEIWPIVGEGEPISHPFTDSLIVKIKRRAQILAETTLGDNKKELFNKEEEAKQKELEKNSIQFKRDSIDKKLDEKSVIHSGEVYQALLKEREELQKEYDALEEALSNQREQMAELKTVIQLRKRGNFLPLGIKQFKNDRKALGYTFLLSEIAVPVALGVGLEHAANQKYNEYKHQRAQTLSDHEAYYKRYKRYHRAAIWAPVAAEAFVYGVNILCNYYCPIKKQNMALHPVLEVDYRGKVQCGVGMSFNF